jgi:hypothetical protein
MSPTLSTWGAASLSNCSHLPSPETASFFHDASGFLDVNGPDEDDRNDVGLLLQRPRRVPGNRDDQVGSEARQLPSVGADTAGFVTT